MERGEITREIKEREGERTDRVTEEQKERETEGAQRENKSKEIDRERQKEIQRDFFFFFFLAKSTFYLKTHKHVYNGNNRKGAEISYLGTG